jgi:hypothetical protein
LTVETNELGGYTVSTVTPGIYKVEITKEGFRSSVSLSRRHFTRV